MVELGEKHYAATVYVISEEIPRKVLLVHHKKFDKWMPPGGHEELLENSYEAAIREVFEETGLNIKECLPKPVKLDERAISLPIPDFILEEKISPYKEHPEHYHLDMIYVVKVPMQEVKHQESESRGIRWFSCDEIEKVDTFDNVRVILNKILNSHA